MGIGGSHRRGFFYPGREEEGVVLPVYGVCTRVHRHLKVGVAPGVTGDGYLNLTPPVGLTRGLQLLSVFSSSESRGSVSGFWIPPS